MGQAASSITLRSTASGQVNTQINKTLAKRPSNLSMSMSNKALPEISGGMDTTEAEWKQRLTSEEYQVLRQKGTERAGTGEYNSFVAPPEGGVFVCRACNAPLYDYKSKFNSGCGWPAFDDDLGTVDRHVDNSFGMKRVEITCKNCGGHLGHVFEGEGFTKTNERHCVNSLSIKFVPGPAE